MIKPSDVPKDLKKEFVRIGQAGHQTASAIKQAKTPKELSGAVIKLYATLDKAIADSPVTTACKPGCDYCCHYRVRATAPEVLLIAQHIQTWPEAKRTALLSRLEKHYSTVIGLSVEQHFSTNIPCPLLENHQCSVYALRPVACRGHHELTSVQSCKATFDHPSFAETGHFSVAIKGFAESAVFGLHHGMKDQAMDGDLYELGTALREALTNPASPKRMRKGSNAFPTVKDRGSLEI